MDDGKIIRKPRTTAVSTIAVQSGNTRIVTALLQSKGTFELKILELQPCMTDVGSSLDEATVLLKQHKDVMKKIQNQQSPVQELQRQVDATIAHQRSKTVVYDSMANNLGQVWKNVNEQLQKRLSLLELTVSYYSKAEQFSDHLKKIQDDLTTSILPNDSAKCKAELQHLQFVRKGILEASLHTLNSGHILLEELEKIGENNLGDARPNHIYPAVQQATSVIKKHMESLHDQKYRIEIFWNKRKLMLEQCLQIFEVSNELDQVEAVLNKKIQAARLNNELGESVLSADHEKQENKRMEKEIKDAQNRAIHLLHKLEKAPLPSHPLAESVKTKAYCMLSECTDCLAHLENRDALLCMSLAFFTAAQQALNKLQGIENQLRILSTEAINSSSALKYSQLRKDVEECVNPALQEGRQLLDKVDRYDPGSQGVVRKVKELENFYHQLKNMIPDHNSLDGMEKFYKQYNMVITWIDDTGYNFLQKHNDMGESIVTAKSFYNEHRQFLSDAKRHGSEIDTLFDSCSSLVVLNRKAIIDVKKNDELLTRWSKLCALTEGRISLAEQYVKFHQQYAEVSDDITNLERSLNQEKVKDSVSGLQEIDLKWKSLEHCINNVRTSGKEFIEAAYKLNDPYLNIKSAVMCVETLLQHLKNQQDGFCTSLSIWKSKLADKDRQLWEQFKRDVEMTTKNVNRLEGNLFPILPREVSEVGVVVEYLKRCTDDTTPKIQQIQAEIEAYSNRREFGSQVKTFQEEDELRTKLQRVYTKLQKDVAAYQLLVSHISNFFHSLKEVDNLLDKLDSEYRTTVLSQDVTQAEIQLQQLDTMKITVTELLKKIDEEAEEVIREIDEMEPSTAARKDREKILHFVGLSKQRFDVLWEQQKKKMKDNLESSHFKTEYNDINSEIKDLKRQLKTVEENYRESLEATQNSLRIFRDLQKGVEHLDQKIRIFMGTFKYSKSDTVQQEIAELRTRWTNIQTEISTLHQLINIAIEFFQLGEEVKEWFKEGSQLLVTVARKSSLCKTAIDAELLIKEVKRFLSTGKTKQEEKLHRISVLAAQLFESGQQPPFVHQLSLRSKDMVESLEVILKELYSLAENFKASEKEKEVMGKETKAVSRELHTEYSSSTQRVYKIAEKQLTSLSSTNYSPLKIDVGSPKLERQTSPKPPVFTVPLSDRQVSEGSKFTFYCQVEAGHNPMVRWYKGNTPIHNNPDYSVGFENNICTLTIEETLPEDSAVYICKVENEYGKAETSAHLYVKELKPQIEPPHFTKELEPGVVKEKEPFKFTCQVTGNPLPLVSWYRKDICIDSSPDYVIIFNNGFCQLQIKEANLEDKGCYSCRATNKAGHVESSATLDVLPLHPIEAPTFVVPLSNVSVHVGQKVQLECEIHGYPIPQVNWSHNGRRVENTQDVQLHAIGKRYTLDINNAHPKDAGTYTVAAHNLVGEAISSSSVTVKQKILENIDSESPSKVKLMKPLVKLPLRDQMVYTESKVELECIIVAEPEPEVIWYHNNLPVKESSNLQLHFQGDLCKLIINRVHFDDAGYYKCVAVNPAGEASTNCTLSVRTGSPTIHQSKYKEYITLEEPVLSPKFTQLLEDTPLVKGENMKLQCKVTGDPGASISWYKDGCKLSNSSKYKIYHDPKTGIVSLTIYAASYNDEGKYLVQASNRAGEAKCYCSIFIPSPKVSPKPAAPEVHPKFHIHLRNLHVMKGQEAKFDCFISGTPKPQVTWYFEDKALKRSDDYIITEDGHRHSLVVLNTNTTDSGKYSVCAENSSGKATSTAFLTVESPSQMTVINGTTEKRSQSVITSERASLLQSNSINRTVHHETSSYEVHKLSSVEGYHREQEVQSAVHKVNYDISNHTIVSSADQFAHSVGLSSTRRITPTVSVKPSKVLPPKFVKPVDCAVVQVDEDIILQGQIEGYPDLNIKWLLDDKELYPRPGLTMSLSDNITSLHISRAKENDSGRYTCTISNSAGTASSTAEVLVKPHRNPPKFVNPLQPCIFKSGDRVQLDIEVTGTPPPQVKWYHNGSLVTDSLSVYTKSEGNKYSLVIPRASEEHSGKLTVKAFNAGGEAQCTVDLIFVDSASVVGKAVSYRETSVVQQTKRITIPHDK